MVTEDIKAGEQHVVTSLDIRVCSFLMGKNVFQITSLCFLQDCMNILFCLRACLPQSGSLPLW